jgi:hypothetical protein
MTISDVHCIVFSVFSFVELSEAEREEPLPNIPPQQFEPGDQLSQTIDSERRKVIRKVSSIEG